MTFVIAWRNLIHDRVKFLITLIGISFSTILIGVQLGVLVNFLHTISIIVDHSGADLWITAKDVPSVDIPTPLQERRRFHALAIPGVAAAEPYLLQFAYFKRKDGVRQVVIVIGVRAESNMGLPFFLTNGADATAALATPGGAIVDRLYAEKLGIKSQGDTFEIMGHKLRVAAFTDGIRTFTQAPYVFVSLQEARELFRPPDNDTTYVLVRLTDPHLKASVANKISERFPDVDVLTPGELALRSQYHWLVSTGAGIALVSSTILAMFVGTVILAQTLYASTTDRLPEYAVIRAMGGRRSYLYSIVLQQAIIGGILGTFSGLAVNGVIVIFARNLATHPEMPPWLIAIIAIATSLMCIIASLASARKVMQIDPVKVFR